MANSGPNTCVQPPPLPFSLASPNPPPRVFAENLLNMSLMQCSNGSQFFITTVPTPHLNGKHTVFGEVVEGQEFIKAVEGVGSSSGTPSEKVVIAKCGSV